MVCGARVVKRRWVAAGRGLYGGFVGWENGGPEESVKGGSGKDGKAVWCDGGQSCAASVFALVRAMLVVLAAWGKGSFGWHGSEGLVCDGSVGTVGRGGSSVDGSVAFWLFVSSGESNIADEVLKCAAKSKRKSREFMVVTCYCSCVFDEVYLERSVHGKRALLNLVWTSHSAMAYRTGVTAHLPTNNFLIWPSMHEQYRHLHEDGKSSV